MEETTIEKVEEDLQTRWLGTHLVEELTKKTPKNLIESRPIRGGGTASYVPGYRFVERLNQVFGFLWSDRILNTQRDGEFVIVQRELSFKIPGRTIVKELADGTKETTIFDGIEVTKAQFGGAQIKRWTKSGSGHQAGDEMDIGNDFKAAATDGLKKCAVSMGMFADVYSAKEDEIGPSESQMKAVYMRGTGLGWSKEETEKWVEDKLGCKLEDAPPSEVSMSLLPALIRLGQEKAQQDG